MSRNEDYENYREEIKKICLRCKVGVVNCPHYSAYKGNPVDCNIIREKLKL